MFNQQQAIGALYARDSREDGNEAFGIDNQIRKGVEYAEKHGIILHDDTIFAEEWTGVDFDRPQFNKLKQLIERREINAVIVYKVNRISRIDYHATMFLREFCFRYKVPLHIVEWGRAVKDDKNDPILFGLQAQFGHIDRVDILERTQRGRREKAEQGIHLGQGITVYGYKKEGAKKQTMLSIVDGESRIIKLIFHCYVNEHISIEEIARFLNAQNIPSPSQAHQRFWQAAKWNHNTVLRILRDPRYTGEWYAFRYVKNELTGKQVLRVEEERIKQHFPALAIVDRDVFDRAQAIIDSKRNRYAFAVKHEYLLNTRIVCACEHKLGVQTLNKNGKSKQYYRCAHKKRYGTQCRIPYLSGNRIDTDVWDLVEAFIRNPEWELQKLDEAKQQQEADHQDAIITLQQLERIRQDHTNEIDRLYSDMRAGIISPAVYKKRKQPLDDQLKDAEKLYTEHQTRLEQKVLTDRQIKHIVKECNTIAMMLDEIGVLEFEHKRRVIDLLNITGYLEIQGRDIILTLLIHNRAFDQVVFNDQLSCSMSVEYYLAFPRIAMPQTAIQLRLIVGQLS